MDNIISAAGGLSPLVYESGSSLLVASSKKSLTSPVGSSSIFVRTCSPSSLVKKCEPTSEASVVMTLADVMTLPSLSVNVMWPSFGCLEKRKSGKSKSQSLKQVFFGRAPWSAIV